MSNVESDSHRIMKRFARLKIMEQRCTTVKDASGIFLVNIDEFAVLRIALIRKNLQKSMTV